MELCLSAGVSGFLVPGVKRSSWSKLANLQKHYSQWRVAYGLHPYFLSEGAYDDLEYLGDQCESGNAIAVGEIGLDNWPGSFDMTVQISIFCQQLSIAKSLKLAVIIHARKSYDLVLKCLRQKDFQHGGVIHAFNGSVEQAKRFLDLGFVLGIGGTISYPRAKKAHRTLTVLDKTAFVLETDSPDMPLCGRQGDMNTPLSVIDVAKHVASIKDMTVEEVANQANKNLLTVFPKWNEDVF